MGLYGSWPLRGGRQFGVEDYYGYDPDSRNDDDELWWDVEIDDNPNE